MVSQLDVIRTEKNIYCSSTIEEFEHEVAELQNKIHLLSLQKLHKKKQRFSSRLEEELRETTKRKNELMQKISRIQEKIFIGGENLLEKAQRQTFLIETTGAEIENLDKNHQQLEDALNKKGQERVDVVEKCSTLQDEDVEVTEQIREVQRLLNEVKTEFAEKEHQHQREMEALLDTNRLLTRQLLLVGLVINSYVPEEDLEKIETMVFWDQDEQKFLVAGVAHTGNNVNSTVKELTPIRFDAKASYRNYPSPEDD